MGAFSQLVGQSKKQSSISGGSRAVWHEVFGTNKEDRKLRGNPEAIPGGSYGRSSLSTEASFKRLLQAMRSMAPGGWSDDRYEQSRHFVGITYVCIHRIGEQMAQAEFQVFKKDPTHPEGKRPVTEHDEAEGDRFVRPYDLVKLLEKPNREDSFGDMMYRWCQQMNLTGKALTWMVPNQLQTPMEIYSIPTALAIPQPAINPDFPDGYYRIQPVYPYGPFSSYPTPASAVGAPIPAQWMLDFKFPHPLLRYDGYSPLSALRLHLDEIESMDRSRWYKMKRSVNPSAVLNLDDMEGAEPLGDAEIERIHAEWENEFQGPENHGRLIVGVPGGKFEEWGTKPIDMDYQAGWDQLVSFAMSGFGITKPAAGMVDDSSYSTLFATLKQLHLLTLEPMCNRIASQLTRRLAPFFGDDLIIEIRTRRIDDHDVRNGALNILIQGKAITKNELRTALDFPTTQDEWGKEIAGVDSQQQQQGQQGMPGMGGGMEQAPTPDQDGQGGEGPPDIFEDEEDEREEPEEVTSSRPTPGNLGRGALGPRKHLRVRRISKVKLLQRGKALTNSEKHSLNGHSKKLHLNGSK